MNDNEMFDRLRRFGDTVDQAAVAAGAPAGPLRDVSDPLADDEGDAAVLIIQDHLGVNADGYFGPATRDAVRQFQSNNGIEVDGLVGPDTWRLLVPEAAGVDVDGDRIIEPTEMN